MRDGVTQRQVVDQRQRDEPGQPLRPFGAFSIVSLRLHNTMNQLEVVLSILDVLSSWDLERIDETRGELVCWPTPRTPTLPTLVLGTAFIKQCGQVMWHQTLMSRFNASKCRWPQRCAQCRMRQKCMIRPILCYLYTYVCEALGLYVLCVRARCASSI